MKRISTPLLIVLMTALFVTATYTVAAQIPSDTDLVYVRVTAITTDHSRDGRPVIGLHKEQFRVFEDNVPQDIVSLSEESLPLDVGILFDISGEMKDARAKVLSGLKKYNRKDDEFFPMEPGKTPLNDAILQALNSLAQGGIDKKRALVLCTSRSYPGAYSFSKVRDRFKELDIQLYVVGLPVSADVSNESAGQALRDLAELSGGNAYFPASTFQLEDVSRKIVSELKNQYMIGYRSTNRTADGKWRKIRITGEYVDSVTRRVARLNIHAKPGYYAPIPPK